ncbi:uncharacterized protein DS421_7g217060 [Arachis hypogaea]|nr:uncharacterized protein DS421_7g217060 [Arachis hypogaea]
MGFDALAHILEMNVSHKLLREFIGCYDDYYGYLDTLYGRIYITLPAKFPQLDAPDTPGVPWEAYWTRSNIFDWIAKKATDTMIADCKFGQRTSVRNSDVLDAVFKCTGQYPSLCLIVSSTTPDPQLQIIAVGGETHSQSLDIPPKEQQQPCEEAPAAKQSEEEAHLDVLGISPPISQPTTLTSQLTVTQLEVLADTVMHARVTAALKFAEQTSDKGLDNSSSVCASLQWRTLVTVDCRCQEESILSTATCSTLLWSLPSQSPSNPALAASLSPSLGVAIRLFLPVVHSQYLYSISSLLSSSRRQRRGALSPPSSSTSRVPMEPQPQDDHEGVRNVDDDNFIDDTEVEAGGYYWQ